MSENLTNDEILQRLRAADPTSGLDRTHPETAGERENVRGRISRLIEGDARPRGPAIVTSSRLRLAIAGVLAVLLLGVGLSLVVGDSGSGPARALAIDESEQWVTLTIEDTAAGEAEMSSELAAAGIDGQVIVIPAQHQDVGRWLAFSRVPPLPPDAHGVGNSSDIVEHDSAGNETPTGSEVSIRREAFTAYPGAHWIFYVGRPAQAGERPEVITSNGPEDAEAAVKAGCPGIITITSADGQRQWCESTGSTQVPRP